MIIPVRCFTCHKVLGDKWEYYNGKVQAIQQEQSNKKVTKEDLIIKDKMEIFFSEESKGKILDELNITKICCRRHMLGHVDLIDLI
jgi:DNA-directed RNA polymerase subunit N (RpoN/RPB10)